MTLYHAIYLRGGQVLYLPTSLQTDLVEFAPTGNMIDDKQLKLIRFKEKVAKIKDK
jgi:hypothetical protein